MIPLSIIWNDQQTLSLLDQTRLPLEVIYEEQKSIEQVWDSINPSGKRTSKVQEQPLFHWIFHQLPVDKEPFLHVCSMHSPYE